MVLQIYQSYTDSRNYLMRACLTLLFEFKQVLSSIFQIMRYLSILKIYLSKNLSFFFIISAPNIPALV